MLTINRESGTPIYQQIYEQLKCDILANQLPVGARITSTRALAAELQIGRNSVENAYDQLALEGYIKSIPGSGYIVNNLEFNLIPNEVGENIFSQTFTEAHFNEHNIKYNFQYGELSADSFPKKLWHKYMADLLEEPLAHSAYIFKDGKGEPNLREEIRKYLYFSRGVKCSSEQLILCSGTQAALEIILRIFNGKKVVAMEDPCYNGASTVFKSNDFEILPVPVHSDGIDIPTLAKLAPPLVHISPSHQFPTGCIMPIQNRMEILNLAVKNNMVIIEDDYDSEFRYKGRPIPSLQSIDSAGRVIYIGTFSKGLSPGLRMAYLVLPTWLLPQYDKKYAGYQCTVPLFEQKATLRFMKEGHWERHIRKICLSQKKKHDILVAAITNVMGGKVKIYGHNAGLHILLEIDGGQKEEYLVKKALEFGIKIRPVSPFWLNKSEYKNNAVVLGYGKIKENDILPAIKLLHKAWFEN